MSCQKCKATKQVIDHVVYLLVQMRKNRRTKWSIINKIFRLLLETAQ